MGRKEPGAGALAVSGRLCGRLCGCVGGGRGGVVVVAVAAAAVVVVGVDGDAARAGAQGKVIRVRVQDVAELAFACVFEVRESIECASSVCLCRLQVKHTWTFTRSAVLTSLIGLSIEPIGLASFT